MVSLKQPGQKAGLLKNENESRAGGVFGKMKTAGRKILLLTNNNGK